MKAWTDPNANYFCISDFDNPRTSSPLTAKTSSNSDAEVINPQTTNSEASFEDINFELQTANMNDDQEQTWTDPNANYFCISCLLYTSPSPRDISGSRMPSSA